MAEKTLILKAPELTSSLQRISQIVVYESEALQHATDPDRIRIKSVTIEYEILEPLAPRLWGSSSHVLSQANGHSDEDVD